MIESNGRRSGGTGPRRVMAYLQVSGEGPGADGLLGSQLGNIFHFASLQGMEVVGVCSDVASASEDQSDLAALEVLASSPEPDVEGVLVYDLTRLHGDRRELKRLNEMLRDRGIDLVSVIQSLPSRGFGGLSKRCHCLECQREAAADARS